jgi:RNA polymerase sigma-70 factor (ECF subfamily)
VDERELLTAHFEAHRSHLRAVAYRMLGSVHEADDALQEAWLRVDRAGLDGVDNVAGWLTTVVARVCLNVLRARRAHGEEPLEELSATRTAGHATRPSTDPEQEALLADSVGLALLVVLDTLTPAERLAFVLHDLFGLAFEEIAPIVDRSPAATRQLASRARRRVRGSEADRAPGPDPARQRRVVDAYLAATRSGDFEALLRLLDPDVVLRADAASMPTGLSVTVRGAEAVARGALASSTRARVTEAALVDGSVGLVMAPRGRLAVALRFTVVGDAITEIDVIGDAARLGRLELAVLDDRPADAASP